MNPYEILGLRKDATVNQIREAYLELAKKYHPDKEGGDEERFKKINEAYNFLNDNEKRKEFDRTGIYPGSKESDAVREVVNIFKIVLFESVNNRVPIELNLIIDRVENDFKKAEEYIQENETILQELKKNSKIIKRKKGSGVGVDCFKMAYETLNDEINNIIDGQRRNLGRLERVLGLLKEHEQKIQKHPIKRIGFQTRIMHAS